MIILLMMTLLLSFIFSIMKHPMTMGLTLLIQTIQVAMITGMLNSNFWFSYILFLIMVGGMLVLFIYMTSIASNEMFSYSINFILISSMMMMVIFILYTTTDMYIYTLNFQYQENINTNTMNYNLTKYFNYPSMLMIFFMIIYLFITLIAIVKITKIEYGPLRQMF